MLKQTHILIDNSDFLYHFASAQIYPKYLIYKTNNSCSQASGRRTFSTSLKKDVDFPVAQTVKNLPSVQETQIQSLGWEDPLEKETATHSSILAWEILWTEEPGGLQCMGSQESDKT